MFLGVVVLRVYDRYSVTEQLPLKLGSLRLVHAINGTRTKNWPIKSSMFQGHDCKLFTNTTFIVSAVNWTIPSCFMLLEIPTGH